MKKGIQITFSTGEVITVIPKDDICEISVGNLTLLASLSEKAGLSLISKAHRATGDSRSVTSIGLVDTEEPEHMAEGMQKNGDNGIGIERYCIVCNNVQYCITGGCANTPCGWICD